MREVIEKALRESIAAKENLLKNQTASIEAAAVAMITCLKSGGKLLIFGNGGSSADSQHMAAELVGRFKMERKALSAISLTANTSILTAIANDYGYDQVFSRQVEALARPGDVVVAISTSGNSPNVLAAVKTARSMGLKSVGISGSGGGKLAKAVDISIVAPSNDTPRVQEAHGTIIHILCELIEAKTGA